MSEQNRFTTALVVSLLLHMLLLSMMQARLLSRANVSAPEPMLDVDVVQLPPPAVKAKPIPEAQPAPQPPPPAPAAPKLPESSIVPMPDAGVEVADDSARFLSDRDNKVAQESVKRGNSFENEHPQTKEKSEEKAPEAVASKPKEKASKQPPVAAETDEPKKNVGERSSHQSAAAKPAALPKLDQLLPRIGDLAMADKGVAAADKPAAPARPAAARNLLPGNANALSSSRSGVAAYLPTVQESDITMLNTKAAQFAPFVRRVAARVFQHLEINLRQQASATVAGSGREYAEVEAVMSKAGERISGTVQKRESDTQLAAYRLLLSATEPDVFFDRNPPPGAAASDGKIHFILMVDLRVDSGSDPGTGRRGTSYYGIAGVGLQ